MTVTVHSGSVDANAGDEVTSRCPLRAEQRENLRARGESSPRRLFTRFHVLLRATY